jgi:hypothetical protein
MKGTSGDSVKEDVKPKLGETPRRPCGFCGEFHDKDGDQTPRRKVPSEVRRDELRQELANLDRAQFHLKKKKRLVKARLLLAQDEMENDEEYKESIKAWQPRVFSGFGEIFATLAGKK